MESVVCTLTYKEENNPNSVDSAVSDRRRFTRAVASRVKADLLIFDGVTLNDNNRFRHEIWFKTISVQEAKFYRIKKMWEKGSVEFTGIDDTNKKEFEKIFKASKAR